MQKNLVILVVVAIVVVAGVVAAWQLTQVPSAEARPIKIGLVAGYQLAEGQDMDRAAKLAVKEINEAGGVYVDAWHTSVEIELITIDTENDSPDKNAGCDFQFACAKSTRSGIETGFQQEIARPAADT